MTKTLCAVLAALALSGCVAFGSDLDQDIKYERIDHQAGLWWASWDEDFRNLWSK